jgi:hypothetical protein
MSQDLLREKRRRAGQQHLQRSAGKATARGAKA